MLKMSVRLVHQINLLIVAEYVHIDRNASCQNDPTIHEGNLELMEKTLENGFRAGGGLARLQRI